MSIASIPVIRCTFRFLVMTIASIPVIRCKTTPFSSSPLYSVSTSRRGVCCFSIPTASVRRQSQRLRQQNGSRKAKEPDKKLLKARESVRQLPAPAPALAQLLSPEEMSPQLAQIQAIGLVAASQANFMRIIVQILPPEEESESEEREEEEEEEEEIRKWIGMELLCVVKAVLKKIKRRVLVGDRVLVGSIDWVDRRGMIEDVFQRKSETADPPVANVDHLLVLFSMDKPRPEPRGLNRFLVEAESTGIPFTLVFNKSELATQEVCQLNFFCIILIFIVNARPVAFF